MIIDSNVLTIAVTILSFCVALVAWQLFYFISDLKRINKNVIILSKQVEEYRKEITIIEDGIVLDADVLENLVTLVNKENETKS
jgi:hypothetical protein